MIYTLYEELREHPDLDPTIGNIPEDLKHRIELYLEHSSRQAEYYDIFLDNQKIGMIEQFRPLTSKERVLYALLQPKRTLKEAQEESEPNIEYIYYYDEYYWTEDDCNDAWYPTFTTLEQLIKKVEIQNKIKYKI